MESNILHNVITRCNLIVTKFDFKFIISFENTVNKVERMQQIISNIENK